MKIVMTIQTSKIYSVKRASTRVIFVITKISFSNNAIIFQTPFVHFSKIFPSLQGHQVKRGLAQIYFLTDLMDSFYIKYICNRHQNPSNDNTILTWTLSRESFVTVRFFKSSRLCSCSYHSCRVPITAVVRLHSSSDVVIDSKATLLFSANILSI